MKDEGMINDGSRKGAVFSYKKPQSRVFDSIDTIWRCAVQYFEYCKSHPIVTSQPNFRNGGTIEVEKPRAMSKQGLCNFMGITTTTWKSYGLDITKEEFHEVVEYVNQVIFQQNYELAAIREFDSAIVIRQLGLADKREETHIVEQPIMNIIPIANTTSQDIDITPQSEIVIDPIDLPDMEADDS